MKKIKKMSIILCIITFVLMLNTEVFGKVTGDVASVIEKSWEDTSKQIKTVVNNVIFPVIDLILAIFFFAKLGFAYFDFYN